jgi:hypothetical protein
LGTHVLLQPKEDDMTVQKLSRREALRGTGVAALAAGAAMVPFVATAMPPRQTGGDLPALLRRYLKEVDHFNATCRSTN